MAEGRSFTPVVVWELGCVGKDVDLFFEWFRREPAATLVDIRYSFRKKSNPWSQKALRERIGDDARYRHYRSLGDVNDRSPGAPVQIEDPDRGLGALQRLLKRDRQPILMCSCEDFEQCHRSTVARLLSERVEGVQVRSVFRAPGARATMDLFS